MPLRKISVVRVRVQQRKTILELSLYTNTAGEPLRAYVSPPAKHIIFEIHQDLIKYYVNYYLINERRPKSKRVYDCKSIFVLCMKQRPESREFLTSKNSTFI